MKTQTSLPKFWTQCAPGCLGWLHMNQGLSTQDIQRCDECARFTDDDAAAEAHLVECGCGWDGKSGEEATQAEIDAAVNVWGQDDLSIDSDAKASRTDSGVWVQAWVFVPNDQL